MKKFAGSDIIVLMKAAQKDANVLREAMSLTKDDFNHDDLIVNFFFNALPDGFSSPSIADSQRTASVLNSLIGIKKQVCDTGLRKAHNYLQNLRGASNEVTELDNSINETELDTSLNLQIKSAALVNFLSKYIDGESNRQVLASVCSDIHRAKFDEASEKIASIFARFNPSQNIKTAFVTIKQQIGEGYQLCPKAIFQSGRPVPMAISNCRDYCIDSRLHPDGTVGCNYLKWLNENVITQEQALNLFDKMDYDKEGIEFMNLEKGERTHFPMSDQNSQDLRMVRDENLTKSVTMKPWEEQLETQHEKEKAKPTEKTSTIASETAIEALLKSVRDVFDEDELDTLEEQIRQAVGE